MSGVILLTVTQIAMNGLKLAESVSVQSASNTGPCLKILQFWFHREVGFICYNVLYKRCDSSSQYNLADAMLRVDSNATLSFGTRCFYKQLSCRGLRLKVLQ